MEIKVKTNFKPFIFRPKCWSYYEKTQVKKIIDDFTPHQSSWWRKIKYVWSSVNWIRLLNEKTIPTFDRRSNRSFTREKVLHKIGSEERIPPNTVRTRVNKMHIFCRTFGQYEYQKMPLALKNSSATFEVCKYCFQKAVRKWRYRNLHRRPNYSNRNEGRKLQILESF